MASLLSAPALGLFTAHLTPGTRALVTGASGWFGRTATDLLTRSGARVLGVASSARLVGPPGPTTKLITWDEAVVRDFAPQIVFDCAFLTRDRLAEGQQEEFVRVNRMLTERMLHATSISSVERVITISSGAAVHPKDALEVSLDENPYGRLKREAEIALAELGSRRSINTVIARAWAVSGAYVQHPRTFALTDMIVQAATAGRITIRSNVEVWRRYVLVEELLAVALATASARSGVVESGGPLVEMSDLAKVVARCVAPDSVIERPPLGDKPTSQYVNDGSDWKRACEEFSLVASDLDEQIDITAAGLEASGFLST